MKETTLDAIIILLLHKIYTRQQRQRYGTTGHGHA